MMLTLASVIGWSMLSTLLAVVIMADLIIAGLQFRCVERGNAARVRARCRRPGSDHEVANQRSSAYLCYRGDRGP
jgi:hypothetical protein